MVGAGVAGRRAFGAARARPDPWVSVHPAAPAHQAPVLVEPGHRIHQVAAQLAVEGMPPGDEAAGAVLRMQVAVGVDHRDGTQAEAEVAADAAAVVGNPADVVIGADVEAARQAARGTRSEEHPAETQYLLTISLAVFCLK